MELQWERTMHIQIFKCMLMYNHESQSRYSTAVYKKVIIKYHIRKFLSFSLAEKKQCDMSPRNMVSTEKCKDIILMEIITIQNIKK